LNAEMLSANSRITQRHAWETFWYEWPFNLRGLLYYGKDRPHGEAQWGGLEWGKGGG